MESLDFNSLPTFASTLKQGAVFTAYKTYRETIKDIFSKLFQSAVQYLTTAYSYEYMEIALGINTNHAHSTIFFR